ncbi:MAG: chemotaxis protein CheW [bacterium]
MSAPIVSFRWDGEEWAFDAADVIEMIGARTVTRVPGTAPRILGIVTWRGRTLPVLLPRALKEPPVSTDLKKRLLVLRRPGAFAVPVDEPGRVIDASAAESIEWASIEAGARPSGLRLLRLEERLVRVLDPKVLVESASAETAHETVAPGGDR